MKPSDKSLAEHTARVDHLCESLAEENPEAIRFRDTCFGSEPERVTKLDYAVLGIARQHAGMRPVLAYSRERIIEVLTWDNDGPDAEQDAWDWYGFNIECLAVGIGTPVIIGDN